MAVVSSEYLVQHILGSLSFVEATKLSIVSKTWLQAWLTLPTLKFTIDFRHTDEIKIVDRTLERYRDNKIPIGKLEISFSRGSPKNFNLIVDKWLDIALRNNVKEIVHNSMSSFGHPSPVFMHFPVFKILVSKSLNELDLRGFDLSLSTCPVATVCDSLRKLSLYYVSLDDKMLQTLLNSCPSIVSLIINHCSGVKNIELLNFRKIKSVSIWKRSDQCVKIHAPSLEHLFYCGDYNGSPMLDIVDCPNLKCLKISNFVIHDGFLEHLISISRSLESLIITSIGLARVNICRSQSLRFLKIHDCDGIGEIDAPNLVLLEYRRSLIRDQLKIAKASSQLKVIFNCQYDLNALWFRQMRKFLSTSISWSQVSLRISQCNQINRNDLQLQNRVATPQVAVVDVYIKSFVDCPTFLDALLWSCHPTRLNLSSNVNMISSFIKYVKNSRHCTSYGIEHWLSQLKDVKAYTWDNQPVELRNEEPATMDLGDRDKIYFLFEW